MTRTLLALLAALCVTAAAPAQAPVPPWAPPKPSPFKDPPLVPPIKWDEIGKSAESKSILPPVWLSQLKTDDVAKAATTADRMPPARPLDAGLKPTSFTFTADPFAKRTLSTGAFPEERKRVQKLTGFPGLKDDFDVVAPATGHPDFPETHIPGVKRYNCIAWTLGIKDRFVWPAKATADPTTGKRVPQPVAVNDFDAEYAAIGLTRRKFVDTTLEPGVKKVALFGKLNDTGELVLTHGAKQEDDGTWTSKLGGEPLIRHRTAEAVSGPAYGNPVAVYAGRR